MQRMAQKIINRYLPLVDMEKNCWWRTRVGTLSLYTSLTKKKTMQRMAQKIVNRYLPLVDVKKNCWWWTRV